MPQGKSIRFYRFTQAERRCAAAAEREHQPLEPLLCRYSDPIMDVRFGVAGHGDAWPPQRTTLRTAVAETFPTVRAAAGPGPLPLGPTGAIATAVRNEAKVPPAPFSKATASGGG